MNVLSYIKQLEDMIFYFTIDTLAKEYGWTIEYILSLPIPVITKLLRIIRQRKNLEDMLHQLNVAKGMSGNISPNFPEDKVSDKSKPKEDELRNLEVLAKKLNLKVERFEK